jgi:hypothetical protein
MCTPLNALLLLLLFLTGCAAPNEGARRDRAERQEILRAPFLAGSGNAQFQLDGKGVLIRYSDRAQGNQIQRDADADAFASQLLAQRGSRAALGGLYTKFPDRVLTFNGLTGNNLFSIYCKGECKDLVLRVRGQAGRPVAAVLRSDMAFPIIEVVQPTFFAISVSFEVEPSRSDLGNGSELSITRWAGQFWHTRPSSVAR